MTTLSVKILNLFVKNINRLALGKYVPALHKKELALPVGDSVHVVSSVPM